MADYTSGGMAGLVQTNKDYDFKSMIAQLRKIEEMPARKLIKWKKDWETRVAGFKDLKDSLTTLKDSLAKLSTIDKFMVKSAAVSSTSVAGVTVGAQAQVGDYNLEVFQLAKNAISAYSSPQLTSKTTIINDSGSNQIFEYTYNGTTRTINIPSGSTLNDLTNLINNDALNPNVRAMIIQNGSQVSFQIRGMDLGAGKTLDITPSTNISNAAGVNFTNAAEWTHQAPQDAKYRINDWPAHPNWLLSSSNTIESVVEGVTFSLRSAGSTTVTVQADTAKIKENIVSFMDMYNTFKLTYQALTAVDSTKQTKDPSLTDSLFDMQQGGVLTGNYVVQLLGSQISQALVGAAKGFVNGGNTPPPPGLETSPYWDPYSSLASIGIITDPDKDSTTFGQLIFDPDLSKYGGVNPLDEALRTNPMAIAELFAAKDTGKTDTNNFSFVNTLPGLTLAGEYSVEYDIDGAGRVINAKIDGKPAIVDGDGKTIVAGDRSSGAYGLTLEVNNLTPGAGYTGKVFVKQGKAAELYEVVARNDTVPNPSDPDHPYTFKGAIARMDDLIAQYVGKDSSDVSQQGIIMNIEKKILKEEERLAKWERTTTAKFARLESTLSYYNSIQKQLESQIKTLGSSSSK
ncbi:flagellar filament capping protein FliD [Desulfovibrio litoralis]|uniref:Flagellar hook-associated protein 2 n=1 Tax=Desulfovibrio litoralis DSM 11393 TaxID=1121455 RepID=A0A1M7RXK9_9BACT|nr:flagellar filament capping protein FliD [Desulfovibrio litoralis]SHN51049.1 flagellar hook-associated protein 2 [Desulfovibrio litoralis DSM 11393]